MNFPTAHSASAAVQQWAVRAEWSGPGRAVNLISYNRFKPDKTDWWIAPGSDNPGYRYAKIIFAPKDAGAVKTPHLFVGLNVEKGVGPTAASAYERPRRCRNYVMAPVGAWAWPSFIDALGEGKLDRAVTEAVDAVGVSCTVAVAVANVLCTERGDEDVHSFEVPKSDRHELQYESTNGSLKLVYEQREAERLIPTPDRIGSLPDLARAVARIDKLDWKWVDFYAGFHFELAASSQRPDLWTAGTLWNKACAPWRPWVWPAA